MIKVFNEGNLIEIMPNESVPVGDEKGFYDLQTKLDKRYGVENWTEVEIDGICVGRL